MQKKIEHHYGSTASECAKGIEKGNLSEVAECISKLGPPSTPEMAVATILANLTQWSVECAF
jgi:hypothetical protein